jgi:hydrogenase expression/formation protein HypE
MEIGKFSSEKLNEIVISKINNKRSEVVLSASVGEDCAAIDLKDSLCVVSTDPITGAVNDVGQLSVHVSVNDIASSGAEPVGILITLLAPPTSSYDEIEKVIAQISDTCDELNLDIVGGHTEVTDAVNRIVVSTTVLGKCDRDKIVSSAGAKIGDSIIVTKHIALEGTSIIAKDYEDGLLCFLSADEIALAKLQSEKLSVLTEGTMGAKYGASAMHDITEGGIYGGVHEVCTSSDKGALINKDLIPILDVTRKICDHFKLNPYRLISSGSMIITIKKPDELIKELAYHGIMATVIGKITKEDIFVVDAGKRIIIDPPKTDELFKLL